MKTIFLFFVAISLTFNTFSQVAIGDKAPVFTATTNEGSTWKLADYLGKKNVVVYFYPRDDTPGCTKEACGFRDKSQLYKNENAIVLGISKDSIASHKKFADKYHLNFPLLSDESKEVIQTYGAWGKKKFMGKEYEGIHRITYLIGPNNEIKNDGNTCCSKYG